VLIPFIRASDIAVLSFLQLGSDYRFESPEVRFVGNWLFGYWNATCGAQYVDYNPDMTTLIHGKVKETL
jgi:hypothetical protein